MNQNKMKKMELKADKFIKDCNISKEDWQTYLDRGTLEHIVANMLMTYHQEQVKKLNINDVSSLFDESLRIMRDLAEHQNGVPLIRYEEEYNRTMTEVWNFLEENETV